jgi:predicted DCC family thiol-disulfide oxidoreductase YuxK
MTQAQDDHRADNDRASADRSATMECGAPLTVYFDGSCALCSVEIGHYASQTGAERLCFVDASDPSTQTGDNLPRDAAMQRFHVRLANGQLVSGAGAFVAIWETLPAWRPLARFARLPGMMVLLEGGYRLFLPIRPLLSRVAAALGARPRRKDAGAATSGGS